MKDRIFIIDGSSYLYRAYHAMPPLTTSKGQPTGAIKGVTNMLMTLKKDSEGSPIIVVFDAKGKTFRSDIYKEYKANRPPMPEDLREQLKPLPADFRASDTLGTVKNRTITWGRPAVPIINAIVIAKTSIVLLLPSV